mgnify:CR=1 FL=1|tara:strand:+ start:214 stop:1224 length:1011 start_codon:yes stop_codon:yes gene_type:complete
MAYTKVTGALVGSLSDLDLTNVGDIQLDSISGDADTNTSITFSGSDVITIATGGSGRLTIGDGALSPVTDNQIDLGTSSLEFKDAFFDGTVTSDAFAGPLTGDVTGNVSGSAATVTTAAQSAITSLGTLTTLTVDNININGSEIDNASGDLLLDSAGNITLDTDGGHVYLKDGGTQFGRIYTSGTPDNLFIESSIQDKDIIFKGNDGGTAVTSLTLDMSNVGRVVAAKSSMVAQAALTSSSNAVAWDARTAQNAYHLTTENTTIGQPTGTAEGAVIMIEIAQGGTARTIAWNSVFEFAESTAPTVTATANKTDIFTFRYNGSVWQEIGRVQNMAQS